MALLEKVVERRVFGNAAGRGWYWAVIEDRANVIAHGVASTQDEAIAEARRAEMTELIDRSDI